LGQPVSAIDGSDLIQLAGAAYAWLKQHTQIVNALNVFPVPDGDTGTNMVLTMQAACKAATESKSDAIEVVTQALAHGAVRGARGNSGVILSQILRGWAESLRGQRTMDVAHFAAAMRQGKETAYKGVMKPVEGTMLTVIREAAEATGHAAAISTDLRFVLETGLARAQQALANTPNLLPVLRQAGVVDAGGQGLVYVLEGMVRHLRGEQTQESGQPGAATAPAVTPTPNLAALEQDEWGYDIQYLVYNESVDENAVRRRLVEMGGESVVVGRAGTVIKVHVHSADPGPFLTYGASLGHLDDIVLENMTLQTLRRKGEWNEDAPAAKSGDYDGDCAAIVAVVSGEGLRKEFASLGVCALVAGGQTMNPSTEELLHAAERLPPDKVIILPNNKNIILAAEAARDLSGKQVAVVPSRSAPQGIAALMALHPDRDVASNAEAMTRALSLVRTGEITRATRSVQLDGVDVAEGALIGLADGKLRCSGPDEETILSDLLEHLDTADCGLVTLYYGANVTLAQAADVAEFIRARYPEVEVEVVEGGQPHYDYILGAE